MSGFAFLVVLFFPTQVPLTSEMKVDRSVYAKLVESGTTAWDAHLRQRQVASFSGTTETENWDRNSQGQLEVVGKYRLAVKHSRDLTRSIKWVHVFDPDRSDGVGLRKVWNERYHFELRGTSTGAAGLSVGSPRLSFVRMNPTETPLFAPQSYNDTLIEMGYRFFGVTLRDLLRPELFEIVRCEARTEAAENGRQHVMAEFRCVLKERLGPLRPEAIYWVELQPERSWLIESAGIRGGATNANHQEQVEYCETNAGGWYPCRSIITRRVDGQSSYDVITTTITDVGPFQSETAEFYLPHYGISESVIELPKHGRLFRVTAVVLGIVFVTGAFWLFRRADRHRNTTR